MIKTVIFMDSLVRSLLEEAESDELNGSNHGLMMV
jgi:hypothetical protein